MGARRPLALLLERPAAARSTSGGSPSIRRAASRSATPEPLTAPSSWVGWISVSHDGTPAPVGRPQPSHDDPAGARRPGRERPRRSVPAGAARLARGAQRVRPVAGRGERDLLQRRAAAAPVRGARRRHRAAAAHRRAPPRPPGDVGAGRELDRLPDRPLAEPVRPHPPGRQRPPRGGDRRRTMGWQPRVVPRRQAAGRGRARAAAFLLDPRRPTRRGRRGFAAAATVRTGSPSGRLRGRRTAVCSPARSTATRPRRAARSLKLADKHLRQAPGRSRSRAPVPCRRPPPDLLERRRASSCSTVRAADPRSSWPAQAGHHFTYLALSADRRWIAVFDAADDSDIWLATIEPPGSGGR